MDISRVSFTASTVANKEDKTTLKHDNKAVANQTDVVSKSANDAVRSSGLALLKIGSVSTTSSTKPLSSEDTSFVEELKEKYSYNEDKKAKPAIDKLTSGSTTVVSDRLSKYKEVLSKDKDVSPMDFVKSEEDLSDLKSRGLDELVGKTETEQLAKLSKARHLLGGNYSVDFATEMVDLDATFDEYKKDLDMNEGVKSGSRETEISQSDKASEFGIRKETVKSLANLAAQAYCPPEKLKPERLGGYEILPSRTAKNGFSATAFKGQDGNIVIAYRGSDDVADIKSDLEMVNQTKLPEQFYDAEQFYNDVKAQYPDSKIILTGHSLGGALSQLVAADNKDTYAVAFNAPGTKDIIEHESGLSDSGNIYNVLVDGDKISNTLAQPGMVQIIDAKTDKYGQKMHPHAIGNCM